MRVRHEYANQRAGDLAPTIKALQAACATSLQRNAPTVCYVAGGGRAMKRHRYQVGIAVDISLPIRGASDANLSSASPPGLRGPGTDEARHWSEQSK